MVTRRSLFGLGVAAITGTVLAAASANRAEAQVVFGADRGSVGGDERDDLHLVDHRFHRRFRRHGFRRFGHPNFGRRRLELRRRGLRSGLRPRIGRQYGRPFGRRHFRHH